ncbi:MAG TPA: M23 family metallopeptidase [Ignavibacteria bacterium]|nr:M23 family metallopeptidase [Ignavibacteria bacterium]
MKIFLLSVLILFLVVCDAASAFNITTDTSKTRSKKKQQTVKQKEIYPSLLALAFNINELSEDKSFIKNPAQSWTPLMTKVRNFELEKSEAISQMNLFINELKTFLANKDVVNISEEQWVFPVKGYTASSIGGRGGNGYVVSNFDFFDLNTGGHPAHDIFINDGNQDNLDDATGMPVEILSMTGGIVVETRKNWTPEMTDIKGGNIVYVYDAHSNGFFYYAHLDVVNVNVGDIVYPATVLGTMGRTGKNAYPSRSPTHLHIMYVKSYDGDLRPVNLYSHLLNAKVVE